MKITPRLLLQSYLFWGPILKTSLLIPLQSKMFFSPVLNDLVGFTILGLIPVMPDMSVPALQSWYWESNRDPRGLCR